jgi:hypothetical protein
MTFWVNDTPVGKRADNRRRADVQLVQFFLHHFYGEHPELFRQLPKIGPSDLALAMDGNVGPQTRAAISLFQKEANKVAPAIVDGRVSVPQANAIPGTTTIYTIFHLNLFFFSIGDNMAFNERLQDHPIIKDLLPELHGELKFEF